MPSHMLQQYKHTQMTKQGKKLCKSGGCKDMCRDHLWTYISKPDRYHEPRDSQKCNYFCCSFWEYMRM